MCRDEVILRLDCVTHIMYANHATAIYSLSLSLSSFLAHPTVYQHTPALPPAPYHKPKYEPVVYEEEYPKQNCSVVDETIKVTYLMLLYLEKKADMICSVVTSMA